MGLHPIMDSTSPSHTGFQVWDGFLNTPGYELIRHWYLERTISESQIETTVGLINKAMNE